jgi:ankyrin repeat protein
MAANQQKYLSRRDIEAIFKASNLVEIKKLEKLKKSILSEDRINNKDENGITALMYTCANNFINLLEFIINECSYVDINIKSIYGETALFYSANNGSFENIKLLIDAGADINIKSKGGYTFFDYLKEEDKNKVLDLLPCNVKPAKRG